MDVLLELRQVEKTYPTREGETAALRGVSFAVERGSFVSVIGPSGAGKSTLLRCVTGQLTPTGGEVLVEGRDMAALRGRRKRQL